MASEKIMQMKSGFVPYGDGSGFAVTVEIEQESDTDAATIHIAMTGGSVDITHWPDICKGVERMLKALP